MTYQQMRQGPYESIIVNKERFNNALKVYIEQKNPKMGDVDIAMDFFHGLDNRRYVSFKTEILNRLTAKSILQPANLNDMYLLANQWVKSVTKGNATGYASTFHTMLDKTNRHGNMPEGGGKQRERKHRGGKQQQNQNQDKKDGNNDKEDSIECFACGELGHYDNKCLQRKKSEESEDESTMRSAYVTWDASTFVTYQVKKVNATGMVGKFKRMEVLLDNQADVSVMHPSLL
jgi:hypothetical protein